MRFVGKDFRYVCSSKSNTSSLFFFPLLHIDSQSLLFLFASIGQRRHADNKHSAGCRVLRAARVEPVRLMQAIFASSRASLYRCSVNFATSVVTRFLKRERKRAARLYHRVTFARFFLNFYIAYLRANTVQIHRLALDINFMELRVIDAYAVICPSR